MTYSDPEKRRKNARKWYAANLEKARERARKWRAANREKIRETHRRWSAANRVLVRQYACKRRTAIRHNMLMVASDAMRKILGQALK